MVNFLLLKFETNGDWVISPHNLPITFKQVFRVEVISDELDFLNG